MAKRSSNVDERLGCKRIRFGKGSRAVWVVRCRYREDSRGKLILNAFNPGRRCRHKAGPKKGLFRPCGRK